jgi:hypothetical protein
LVYLEVDDSMGSFSKKKRFKEWWSAGKRGGPRERGLARPFLTSVDNSTLVLLGLLIQISRVWTFVTDLVP